jgi:transcription elongation GreA/GreB family factor
MDDDAARHISREGLAALEAELRELETEGRRAIADRIRTAREWGDQGHERNKELRADGLGEHAGKRASDVGA